MTLAEALRARACLVPPDELALARLKWAARREDSDGDPPYERYYLHGSCVWLLNVADERCHSVMCSCGWWREKLGE